MNWKRKASTDASAVLSQGPGAAVTLAALAIVLVLIIPTLGCAIPLAKQPAPQPAPAPSGNPKLVSLESASPLVAVKIMVKAGSTSDPRGKEGLANLVASSLIQGGFGDPAQPVTNM